MRLRLPRNTIRLRLTLAYGGLFLVSGAALLVLIYVLARSQYTNRFFVESGSIGLKHTVQIGPNGAVQQMTAIGPGPGVTATQKAKKALIDASGSQASSARHTLLLDSGIALGGMALVSLGLGWLVAGRALRPLRTITTAAQEISASNLHRRLALTGPDDELKQLGATFDDLLARLEQSFEAQRQFVANASHELRTPLTLERTLIEVALADPDATEASLRAACEQVLAAGEQQEKLIEALLTLSRGQRGLDHREPVELSAIAASCLAAAGDDLAVATQLEPTWANGDPRLLERLVSNLVTNAVRHNVPNGRVEVRTSATRDSAVLVVENTGPAVSDVEGLFEPFRRSRSSNGLGLGLSIVRAIADAHDATIAAKPLDGGGLSVEVLFPAAT